MEGEGEGRLGCTAEIYDVPIVHGGVSPRDTPAFSRALTRPADSDRWICRGLVVSLTTTQSRPTSFQKHTQVQPKMTPRETKETRRKHVSSGHEKWKHIYYVGLSCLARRSTSREGKYFTRDLPATR